MSLLKNLGLAVGIGSCTLEVQVDTPSVEWGEPVTGKTLLRGGELAQQVTSLKATLMEYWVAAGAGAGEFNLDHHWVPYGEASLAGEMTVAAGETREFEFTLDAPRGVDPNHQWLVEVHAEIPGAVDQKAYGGFELRPPAVFARAGAVLAEVSGLRVAGTGPFDGGLAIELLPEGELVQIYDGLRLELRLEGGELHGELEVNPQEHTVADVLRSFVRADRKRYPISIPADDVEAARARFAEILSAYRKP